MRIATITDLHFGARGNDLRFDNFFENFYKNSFFPYLDQNKDIKHILCSGDVFDNRKNINFEILSRCKNYFFNEIVKRGLELTIICGNHDSHYKNTLKINALRLLLNDDGYDFDIVDEPKVKNFGGTEILLMPWICEDNIEKSMKLMDNTKAKFCFGHFEIFGFSMYKGVEARDGIDPKLFSKFKHTFSGHYHTKSTKKNITYLGTPYEIVWSDYNDPKGFNIFETTDGSLDFIENPYTMFTKFEFDGNNKDDAPDFSNKIVRLIIKENVKASQLETFLNNVRMQNPIDVSIIDTTRFEYNDEELDVTSNENTISMIKDYIFSLDGDSNGVFEDSHKRIMYEILERAYMEANKNVIS